MKPRVDRIERGPQPGETPFIPSPWVGMNEALGGWLVNILTLLVCHTGGGKSSLLRSCALAAARAGHPALLLSTEDPEDYTVDRFLAELTGIPTADLTRLDADKAQVVQLRRAQVVEAAKLITVVSSGMTPEEILDTVTVWVSAQREKTSTPLWVGVDYLQNIAFDGSMEEGLAKLGIRLNQMAHESDLAVVAASQVRSEAVNDAKRRLASMKPPTATPKNWLDFVEVYRPGLGDAEWCRRLEKAAKCVISTLREGYWARLPPLGWGVEDDRLSLQVLKNNFGRGTGGVQHLRWVGETQTTVEM